MSALVTARQFSTATTRLRVAVCTNPSLAALFEVKSSEEEVRAEPNEPNIGRYMTGCGVGIEAFASPITLHAINPPLTMISGFTPKKAGCHRTRSASFPRSIEQ